MVKVESRIENRTAGATKRDPATVKGKIVEFLIRMTNQGYHESSVKIYSNILKWLIRAGANLWDPESVKKAIGQKKWSVKTKAMAVGVYNAFARVNGLDWDTPKYQA